MSADQGSLIRGKRNRCYVALGLYAAAILLVGCSRSGGERDLSGFTGQGLVSLGPTAGVEAHIEYVQSTWPSNFAIALVHPTEEPDCSAPTTEVNGAGTTYCWVEVRADELLAGSWNHLEAAKGATPAEFRLHYWYPSDETRHWKSGQQLLVFLAPTHSYTVYVGTAILEATEEVVIEIRNALV